MYYNNRLTENQLINLINDGEVKYVTVCFPIYHTVNYKRFEAHYFVENVLKGKCKSSTHIFGTTIDNSVIQNEVININEGYQDNYFDIDLTTIRKMSWLGREHAICMAINLVTNTKQLYPFSPRNILMANIKYLKNEFGVSLNASSELEFYIFKSKNYDIIIDKTENKLYNHTLGVRKHDYEHGVTMDYNEFLITGKLKDNIVNCGIQLEGLFSEGGCGQHEVNIKYTNVLDNCDNHIFMKQCIKSTCYSEGFGCTFMAKPFSDQAGNSFHCHISLYDDHTGLNIFAPTNNADENFTIENKNKNIQCSKKLLFFIGGLTHYSPELFLIYAPLINSYKRYRKTAIGAPFFVNTWGYENRTTVVRVIGEEENLHIEFRIPAADANPYLVFSAIMISGMEGIKNTIMPHEIVRGNAYNIPNGIAPPKNLYEAIKAIENSQLAKKIFGEEYIKYILGFSYHELELYELQITNYEINRYLDLI